MHCPNHIGVSRSPRVLSRKKGRVPFRRGPAVVPVRTGPGGGSPPRQSSFRGLHPRAWGTRRSREGGNRRVRNRALDLEIVGHDSAPRPTPTAARCWSSRTSNTVRAVFSRVRGCRSARRPARNRRCRTQRKTSRSPCADVSPARDRPRSGLVEPAVLTQPGPPKALGRPWDPGLAQRQRAGF